MTQDFLQNLKIVWLNKTNMVTNEHHAYQMIPLEKPDIVFLRNRDEVAYDAYTVRIVNIEGKPNTEKFPTNSISQIKDAKFDKLDITPLMHYLCDAIVSVTFDDAPDPQVLTLEVIGEIGGTIVRAG
ncbi:MAG: hypothetical protein EZS28_018287 [Streblomastix strix]|uniref:Uncharacterized protein n=1 Tax=Streblomastix strix TaxID=222440 RepID=A0A5J4VV75_9EUKA|nr:MAG: hypothetical protein EZS28_018287 [Streblomastix strix]